jgi:hypothetical protein
MNIDLENMEKFRILLFFFQLFININIYLKYLCYMAIKILKLTALGSILNFVCSVNVNFCYFLVLFVN